MFCKNCGIELNKEANFCKECGTPTKEVIKDMDSKEATPVNKEKPSLWAVSAANNPKGEYQDYNIVPWYRKSGMSSWFVLLGWILFPPLIWIVAYALATGDIYYNKTEQNGNLKKWSKANKVVAWIIIIVNILFLINILI